MNHFGFCLQMYTLPITKNVFVDVPFELMVLFILLVYKHALSNGSIYKQELLTVLMALSVSFHSL